VRIVPKKNWVITKAVVVKPDSIFVIDAAKDVTRCYLIEILSPEAEAAGYKKGDMVIAQKVYDMMLKKRYVSFPIDEIIFRVEDWSLDDFVGLDGKPLQGLEAVA
jgi:hypothetical protein